MNDDDGGGGGGGGPQLKFLMIGWSGGFVDNGNYAVGAGALKVAPRKRTEGLSPDPGEAPGADQGEARSGPPGTALDYSEGVVWGIGGRGW